MPIDPEIQSQEIARDLQNKFEAYFLALTFTVLGLSIQSASFQPVSAGSIFEIIGWLALLVSGVCGLARAEWRPVAFGLHSQRVGYTHAAIEIKKAKINGAMFMHVVEEGRTKTTEQLIRDAEESVKLIESSLTPVEKKLRRLYRTQKFLFLLGLGSVMASRAWLPVSVIVQSLAG